MNKTTSGCGNCYYYFNGQCTKVDECMHIGNYNTIISNHTIGINEAGPSLPNDIVYNLPDDFTIPNVTVPEDMWYPREEYRMQIGVFFCPICGNEMPWYEGQSAKKVRICDECKRAIAWAKEKMKIEMPSVEVE